MPTTSSPFYLTGIKPMQRYLSFLDSNFYAKTVLRLVYSP